MTATVRITDLDNDHCPVCGTKFSAGIRLINAAPDMLAALKFYVQADGDSSADMHRFSDLVHAAIAKAEGRRS